VDTDTYRSRPRFVQAHHVNQLHEAVAWVRHFDDCTPTLATFATDQYLKVHDWPGRDAPRATFVARPGQWIVREGEAHYRVLSERDFARDFETRP
jgi:hypothetical protein